MISLPYLNIKEIGYYKGGYTPYTNNEVELVSLVSEGDNSNAYVYNNLDILKGGTFEYNILNSDVAWRGGGSVELELKAETYSDNNMVSLVVTDTDFKRFADSENTSTRQFIINVNPQKIGIRLDKIGIDNKNEINGGFTNDLSQLTDNNMYHGYKCVLFDRETGADILFRYTNNDFSDSLQVDMCITTKSGFRQYLFNDFYAVGFTADLYNENAWSRTDRGHIQTYVIDNTTYMNGCSGVFEPIKESNTGYMNRFDYSEGLQYKITFNGKDSYYSDTMYIEHVFTKDMLLSLLGCFGLYVTIGNIEYMPEILGDRCCTGRLIPPNEQAASDSLIKEWTDTNPTIITPVKPEENELENIGLNENMGNSRFVRWYIMTPEQMLSFQEWLNSDDRPTGFDSMKNIISVSEFMFDLSNISYPVGTSSIKIGTEVYGDFGGAAVGSLLTNITRTINIGSVTISRYNNDFTDYAPYSTYDVYVPYCGWVELDSDIVVGNTIDTYLIADPIYGGCKGLVMCNGNIVAEVNGTFGNSIPISSNNIGQYKQALLNNALAIGSGVIGSAVSAASGNVVGVASGALSLISGVSQSIALKHTSFSDVKGNTTTATMYNTYDKCVLVETHPIERIASNYGHTVGFVTNKTKVVNTCSGFVKAENVDTSGLSCSYSEKQAIKAIMESGFYC